ncbi:MAG TPA: amino acid adenylation domain-containing protein [Streptosporangiaceae bacterium]|nr:amino acid adenylation domain-containing protein [Streptosporangiaceae bacterium]
MMMESAGESPRVAPDHAVVEAGRTGIARSADPAAPVPLSFAQRRLWLVHHLFPDSPFYHVPVAYRLNGVLDKGALGLAFNDLIARHNVLRASYYNDADGTPVQVINPPRKMTIPVIEISGASKDERLAKAREVARERSRILFALGAGYVIRADLLRLDADDHILLIVIHHIVADHWSLAVLAKELSALYAARARGGPATPAPLPPLPRQYADHAELQARRLGNGAFEGHLDYWRKQLADLTAPMIPGDRPRPPVPDFEGARTSVVIDRELMDDLRVFSRKARVTVFAVILAGLNVLLSRYCGTDDIAVGCAMADRSDTDFEQLIGAFVDTVVIRTDLADDPTFNELVRRVQRVTLDAHEHRDLPFEKLVEVFAGDRDVSYTPFFTVAVSYLSAPTSGLVMPGLEVTTFGFDAGLVRFDADFFISEKQDVVTVDLDYRTDIFDRQTMERLLTHYVRLLGAATGSSERPVSELSLLDDAESAQVARFGGNPVAHAAGSAIPELIAAQAIRAPSAPAIACGDRVLSYSELDQRADALAGLLRQHGVGPDVLVGVGLRRSAELVVAMLGVLKAGGGYLALDPDHPADRLAYIVRDSGVGLVIGDPALGDDERYPRAIVLDPVGAERSEARPAAPSAVPGPAHLAYAIYTSGSTGKPKGVLVTRAGLANLCHWHIRRYEITASDRATMVAAQSFDASVWELWPYLVAGACVCIADDATRTDPDLLSAWVREQGASVMFAPTPMAELLMSREDAADLPVRALLTGGDTLRRRPPAGLPFELVNHYGPTECSVVATAGAVSAVGEAASVAVPDIGGPIDNVKAAVLNKNMRPVPIGIVGELYLGGAGVARGYIGRAALTAERFVPDPDGPPGARLYRTGDLVRWRPDGMLEFHGRTDRQIKIRGYRIEPIEIEARLCAHPAVTEAVVTAVRTQAGQQTGRLAAFMTVAGESEPVPGELRAWLAERLPDYMVPATFTVLPRLPLTSSGKIDYAGLPEPPSAGEQSMLRPPRTDIERRLETIFNEVFDRSATSLDDDFFELGGHSVLAVMLVGRIQREFGVKLPVRSVLRATIERLAAEIGAVRLAGAEEVNRRLLDRLSAMSPDRARELLEEIQGGQGRQRAGTAQ